MEPDTDHQKELQKNAWLTDQPDRCLLRDWKQGDERAAQVLFDRYAIRLVALVASRLNRRYRTQIDADEIVQSALGSFFDAAKHSRIQVSQSVSLWRLLATFARRKLTRSIERHSAAKRGGDRERVALELVASEAEMLTLAAADADQFVKHLKAELPADQFSVVEGLLAGQSQREIAESLGIDERTVRRRLARIRELLGEVAGLDADPYDEERSKGTVPGVAAGLPRVNYNAFVLGALIGSGGFGKVYRARMQSDGSTVAVKFLRKAFWQNEQARESFVREIEAASKIQHPGVIRYFGYGESPHGGPYVLSQWIDGRPMHKVERPEESRFVGWLRQICEAMQAVHEAGLIHGDLTPANILIDECDRVTITDFGFSQGFLGPTASVLGGTLGFAAAEQIDPAFGKLSPKTDIYALGGLIHWQLFGHPPNAGCEFADSLTKTVQNRLPQRNADFPTTTNLLALMQRCLASSPADRTMSVKEIMRYL